MRTTRKQLQGIVDRIQNPAINTCLGKKPCRFVLDYNAHYGGYRLNAYFLDRFGGQCYGQSADWDSGERRMSASEMKAYLRGFIAGR